MAQITDNLGYVKLALERSLAERRDQVAYDFEHRIKRQIQSGEGQHPYSTRPTWFNTTRIPRFEARLKGYAAAQKGSARDRLGRYARRSRYGDASVYMERGYAEYKEVTTGSSTPVDFTLTGELVRAIRGRARRAAGGGIHAWLGFERQRRSYGTLTNRELAEVLGARNPQFNPFLPTQEMADDIISEVVQSALVDAGAS
jgi:hypothetical protein